MEKEIMGYLIPEKQKPADAKREWFLEQNPFVKPFLKSFPVDIIRLAYLFGFTIYACPVPDDNDGFIYIGEKPIYRHNKVIAFNSKMTNDEKHARFIIAHELAHYIDLWATNKKEPTSFSEVLLRLSHVPGRERDENEQVIDYLAASILIPSESLKEKYRAINEQGKSFPEITRELSDYYDVEEIAIIYRLSELGICSH